jgi:hypothetical protein
MATLKEMMVRLGALRTVEPVIDVAFDRALQQRFTDQEGDSPHGWPWHVSFHASSFPGDNRQACPRFAMYGLMDIPKGGPSNRWLQGVAEAGKAIELNVVRAARDAGFLARANETGRSSDPDARDENGKPMPQIGFIDHEHWLTGSVDMPLLPFNYDSAHIVEIKTKHESQIEEMEWNERSYNEEHRRQLLCSLGLARENPLAFLHPTEDRLLAPATDGAIYYHARDVKWPGPTKTFEYYFEHNPGFMEEGRAKLKKWKTSFLDGELPVKVLRKNTRSHPNGPGWRWSEGACKYCPLKKTCRADYDNDITGLEDSHAVALASFTRPGYAYKDKRAAVLGTWGLSEEKPPE